MKNITPHHSFPPTCPTPTKPPQFPDWPNCSSHQTTTLSPPAPYTTASPQTESNSKQSLIIGFGLLLAVAFLVLVLAYARVVHLRRRHRQEMALLPLGDLSNAPLLEDDDDDVALLTGQPLLGDGDDDDDDALLTGHEPASSPGGRKFSLMVSKRWRFRNFLSSR